MPRKPKVNDSVNSEIERITPRQISRRLLVEGRDDKDAVWHFLKRFDLEGVCEIKSCGGYDNLRRTDLKTFLRAAEAGDRIGIIVDADVSVQSRWRSISDALKPFGYSVPKGIDSVGMVIPAEVTVGVWIMPNNSGSGAIEDFARQLIAPDDTLLHHAVAVVSQLPPPYRFPEVARRKAELHSWLAWQKEPGCQIGSAITQKILDVRREEAQPFLSWFRRLFVDDPPKEGSGG